MGLDEPDIDLSDLLNNSGNNSSGSGQDISDMDRKDLVDKVLKEGQVNLGGNRALIKCPCTLDTFGKHQEYMCGLSMRPDPEDGKQKPVCSGPIEGRKLMTGDPYAFTGGKPVRDGCPYSPARFRKDKDRF